MIKISILIIYTNSIYFTTSEGRQPKILKMCLVLFSYPSLALLFCKCTIKYVELQMWYHIFNCGFAYLSANWCTFLDYLSGKKPDLFLPPVAQLDTECYCCFHWNGMPLKKFCHNYFFHLIIDKKFTSDKINLKFNRT